MGNLVLLVLDTSEVDQYSWIGWILLGALALASFVPLFFVSCFHYSWWCDRRERKRAEASGIPTKSFDEELEDAFSGTPDDEESEVETNPNALDPETWVSGCDGLQAIETEKQLKQFCRNKSDVEHADTDDPQVGAYYRTEEEMVEEYRRSRELLDQLRRIG